jgi:hypothetical protein
MPEHMKDTAGMFAVAFRDEADLWLHLRIRRDGNGDIYTMIPTGRNGADWKKWNPHASLHKDGNFHHKSFNKKMLSRKEQSPNGTFSGTKNVIQRPIAADEPRGFGVKCNADEFERVFEISISEIPIEKYSAYLFVDICEPGKEPEALIGTAVATHVFDDATPHIVVTLTRASL